MFPVDLFGDWTHYFAPTELRFLIILITINIGLLRSRHACSVLAVSPSLNLLCAKTRGPFGSCPALTVQL
jgi:hypothetical protein